MSDLLIDEATGFSPLVVELPLDQFDASPRLLRSEVACVLPVWPDVGYSVRPLSEVPHITRGYVEVHDENYFRARNGRQNSGNYVKHRPPVVSASDDATVTLGTAWPAKHLRGAAFQRRLSPKGIRKGAGRVRYLEARSPQGLIADWDGRFFQRFAVAVDFAKGRAFATEWERLFPGTGARLAGPNDPFFGPTRFGDPLFNLSRYPAFCSTPGGWVSVVDGYDFDEGWGMRGVIDHQWYGGIVSAWHFSGPGSARVRRGDPFLRLVSVPQELLRADVLRVSM